ncbi:MAG TPA: D-2-hydroxyacid dehydrogenase family protein [Micromonosporaceae bacterium]|jgi:D-3-phosphoglycerate dehydrogenase|nr:D-2-hydroxyacid dehydrogenase family protein [Micromonosporaceae bacterium]
MKVAILDDYLDCALDLADWSRVASRADLTVFTEPLRGPDRIVQALRDFEVLCLMRDRMPLSADTLARLEKLAFITFTGGRNQTLDTGAALARGIQVSYTGGALTASTTELIWALVMATARQLPTNDASLRAGTWQRTLGTVLASKTLGIIGLGRLGRRIAAYGNAFDMSVIAWSPHLTDDAATAAGARRVDRDELLSTADVVTVHVALNAGTRGLIGARELGLMKRSAYLVNTSRGPIVDEAALIDALTSGTIAGAGLDVYDVEPLPADHPLTRAPNTVLLPHLGFVSRENLAVFYQESADNVAAWLDGAPIRLVTA